MIAHPFGVIGLALNTAGAIGLVVFTANPDANATLTHEQQQSLRSRAQRLIYAMRFWAYRVSFAALAIGSFLQLLDLLRG
jgi:hypothetical protein